MVSGIGLAAIIGISILILAVLLYLAVMGIEKAATEHYAVVPDHVLRCATVEKFLSEMASEKPIRFTPEQLEGFTGNYSYRLGAGGFGTVYKGALPNGLAVAVKVLHGGLDQRSEEQFMAKMGTVGRTHHINLVRLFGFCFHEATRALVYEFMENGSLDMYLLDQGGARLVSMTRMATVATGIARGLRYLHEECQQKIIHYDIKAGNVLLDGTLTPKVADFGLAQMVNRADTHVSVSGVRGTPGYAAPEMWMQSGVTEKCDVYSFGMLLLEIIGRKKNFDGAAPESQQWFPVVAWTKYESNKLMELVVPPGHGDMATGDEQLAERMCKVAFWCVQQQPRARPPMGAVVKMLEGEMDIAPPANPFQHLMAPALDVNLWTTMTSSVNTVPASANGSISHDGSEIMNVA